MIGRRVALAATLVGVLGLGACAGPAPSSRPPSQEAVDATPTLPVPPTASHAPSSAGTPTRGPSAPPRASTTTAGSATRDVIASPIAIPAGTVRDSTGADHPTVPLGCASWTTADGVSGSDRCAIAWQDLRPGAAFEVAGGSDLLLWTGRAGTRIERATARAATPEEIEAAGGDEIENAAVVRAAVEQGSAGVVRLTAPGPGSWVVRIELAAVSPELSWSTGYFFRLEVTPD